MHNLALHPSWQTRLREEVKIACGHPVTSGSGIVSSADATSMSHEMLGAMPWLGCVINETMRLLPSVTQIARVGEQDKCMPAHFRLLTSVFTASQDITLEPASTKNGTRTLHVKAGTAVQIPIGLMHRDSRFWDAPDEFRPERFKDGIAAASRHPLCVAAELIAGD